MRAEDWAALAPEFSPREFVRPDRMSRALMSRLIEYRRELGRLYPGASLTVTSSYREPQDKLTSGGKTVVSASRSFHFDDPISGVRAVDVVPRGVALLDAYLVAERFGFGGLGVYYPDAALHLDVRPGALARWARWSGVYRALDREFLLALETHAARPPGASMQAAVTQSIALPLLGGVLLLVLVREG